MSFARRPPASRPPPPQADANANLLGAGVGQDGPERVRSSRRVLKRRLQASASHKIARCRRQSPGVAASRVNKYCRVTNIPSITTHNTASAWPTNRAINTQPPTPRGKQTTTANSRKLLGWQQFRLHDSCASSGVVACLSQYSTIACHRIFNSAASHVCFVSQHVAAQTSDPA